MRTLCGLILVSVLFLVGCVQGSGNVVTREEPVSPFTGIQLQGRGTLVLTQGDDEGLVIEAEDNIMKHITSEVENGQLHIKLGNTLFLRTTKPVVYHVHVQNIEQITLAGSCGVSATTPIRAPKLEMSVAGASDMELSLDTDTLLVNLAGAGDMKLHGRADDIRLNVAGAIDVNALKLMTQRAEISANGAASVELSVAQTLAIEANGACEVAYRGDAEVIKQEVSGTSSITRLDGQDEEPLEE